MSGIDRTTSVKQIRATKDGPSAQNLTKNPKTPVKSTSTSGYRLRSLPEVSSPAVKEKRRDDSPDSSKSPKTAAKRRSALKINKFTKPRSSPYATRSLSPLVSVLRNGKRKLETLRMIPKFKKRVVGDREDVKPVVLEVDKNEKQSRLSLTPESLPKQSRKRNVPAEKGCSLSSKKSQIDRDAVSDSGIKCVKDLIVVPSIGEEVDEEIQDKVSEALENLLDETSIKKECEKDSTTQNSGDVFEMSLGKSSPSNILIEFSDSHFESDNVTSTDDLISKNDSNNSCDIMFDLSKCGSCLQPVIVGTKENLDSHIKSIEGLDSSLPEMLYLSDSQSSFEKVSETFNRGTAMQKTDLEVDRCTLDDCSDILSIENSSSSLIVCNSAGRNVQGGASLPPYGNEDESVSVNATCDSLPMLDAEESMNEFMHEISSSKGREDTLDFAESSNDSNHIDATSIIKTLEQTEPLSDEMDTLSKDPEMRTFGVNSKTDGSDALQTVKCVTTEGIVDVMREGCNVPQHDLNENLKETNLHLSVYDHVPVGLGELHENYSFNPSNHLQDCSDSIHGCGPLSSLGRQGNSNVLNSDQKPPSIDDTFSVNVSEPLTAPKMQDIDSALGSSTITQELNGSLAVEVGEPLRTMEVKSISCASTDHPVQDMYENSPEGHGKSLEATEEMSTSTDITTNLETLEAEVDKSILDCGSLNSLEEHGESLLTNQKSIDVVDESPSLHLCTSENPSGATGDSIENTCEQHKITCEFIGDDDKSSEEFIDPGQKIIDGHLEKASVCRSKEEQPLLPEPAGNDVTHVISETLESAMDSAENLNVSTVDSSAFSESIMKEPIALKQPDEEAIDVLNEELSKTTEFDVTDPKESSRSTLECAEISALVEGKRECIENLGHEKKLEESNESVTSNANENAEAQVGIEIEAGKNIATTSKVDETQATVMDQIPCEDQESQSEKVYVQESTPSEAGKVDESFRKTVADNEEDSAEQLAIKETILNALGLQSSRTASMAKSTVRQELPPIPSRTSGTLKTIIKVPKMAEKKRARNPLRLSLDFHRISQEKEKDYPSARKSVNEQGEISGPLSSGHPAAQDPLAFRIFNESCMSPNDSWDAHISKHKSKSQGNSRKFHSGDHLSHLDPKYLTFSGTSVNGISPSSSIDWQSKSCQELDQNVPSDGSSNSGRSSQQGSSEGSGEASLVIPEKSASFSIHPERLCHDVCCYCFGKFGSLDTPMHLAQMKGEEKRQTALALEANLSQDSCLCDACYRYLVRKATCPSYQPNRKQSGVSGGILTKPQVCCVRGCSLPAHHLVRRKWLTRLRRTISKLLPIELTPVPSHQQQPLHAPLCSRHFYCLEYYSLCGICKRKLSRNNMHPVGREVHALNSVLMEDAIPVTLTGKIFLCKMCRYYSGIRLKYRDKSMLSSGHQTFFDGYRKRIWHYLGIQTLDSSEISEPMEIPKKKKKSRLSEGESSKTCEMDKLSRPEDGTSGQTAEIISSESGSEVSTGKSCGPMPTKIRLKLGNVSIGQLDNVDLSSKESKGQALPSCSNRGKSEASKPKKKSSVNCQMKNSCFPGIEHLGLNASFVFHGNSGEEKNKEWEKCTTTIQFDSKTKKLWQNLYYPYGNFSSFIRHLVIMEKNWRNGDLILAPNASSQAVNYVNSVQNRIAAYEGNSPIDCMRSALLSTSGTGKPVSSRTPVSTPASLPSKSSRPNSSTSSILSTPISSAAPVDVAREPLPLLRLPPMVISKANTVPQKITKETHILPSPSIVPRISLSNSQISQRSQTITAPVTAQLIPVSAATNFLPITCGPSQFISFGSTSSFIQFGGSSGLVHPVSGPYPCVQFNQQIMTDKVVVDKGGISGNQGYWNVKDPPSSLSKLELHISNVRSLANDAGSSSSWEQPSEKQVMHDENACTSDSATQSSGRSEEHSLEVNSVGSVASLSTGTLSLETSDNHSDEAVGNSTIVGGIESQGNHFETV
ncbi:serine-rich adhesin for platelets isoform X2 [Hetaerina americana]